MAQPAVMATRPAIAPLSANVGSGLPEMIQASTSEPRTPAAADRLVVTAMAAIDRSVPATVLPALNPNQPNQSRNTPSAASGRLWPWMALTITLPLPPLAPEPLPWLRTYLPSRAPSTMAPASPAQPPTECTTVEPAKSIMPRLDSHPPPQIQCPTTG